MRRALKRILFVMTLAALAGGGFYLFRPQPLVVEIAAVQAGPLQVTIDEDGQTRAHDRFTLAAPVTGFLSRITLHEGDTVKRDAVIASVRPLPLDSREETGMRAQVAAAEAVERESTQLIARAEAAHDQAKSELTRAGTLLRTEDISRQRFEEAQSREKMAAKDVEAARFRAASATAEVARARAGLISAGTPRGEAGPFASIRAPFEGRILRIFEKSERVVPAGTPIVLLSNPGHLEIVADLLTTDAVMVKPGAAVTVVNWGGPRPLPARVRMVEPYGFTKVSALGVEEQRVNVIADLLEIPANLGDGYRVDVRIVVWECPRTIKVPASALFRVGSAWNVFAVENGVAKLRPVTVGHRNALEAEVLNGLQAGQQVILHPASALKDGAQVKARS